MSAITTPTSTDRLVQRLLALPDDVLHVEQTDLPKWALGGGAAAGGLAHLIGFGLAGGVPGLLFGGIVSYAAGKLAGRRAAASREKGAPSKRSEPSWSPFDPLPIPPRDSVRGGRPWCSGGSISKRRSARRSLRSRGTMPRPCFPKRSDGSDSRAGRCLIRRSSSVAVVSAPAFVSDLLDGLGGVAADELARALSLVGAIGIDRTCAAWRARCPLRGSDGGRRWARALRGRVRHAAPRRSPPRRARPP